MTLPLRPRRGGFLRPFGCAWFIREFLLGKGPAGSAIIDPKVGAPQTDIHRAYKEALHGVWAEDLVALEEEGRIKKGLPPLTVAEAEERKDYYLEQIPYKLTKMRYGSFTRYFCHLKRLRYVEEADQEEPSRVQESYPPAPPRRYYRLTEAGKRATVADLSDPIITLYHYPREKRSPKTRYYSRKKKR